MTENAIVSSNHLDARTAETVLVGGDLSGLSPAQRLSYYRNVCSSIGLNEATRPFEYITLNGKLTLYARKDAADQLRKLHGVSIGKPDIQFQDDWIIVTVEAIDKTGRKDADVGMVKKSDMRGDLGNAVMKAVTKAKRRVTLSICGLGMLDETEVETIPGAHRVSVEATTGEIVEATVQPAISGGHDLAWAKTIKDSKGRLLADMNDSQLQWFWEHAKNDTHDAAGLLLDDMIEKAAQAGI